MEEKLHDIGLNNDFSDIITIVQGIKTKISKWDYIKVKVSV